MMGEKGFFCYVNEQLWESLLVTNGCGTVTRNKQVIRGMKLSVPPWPLGRGVVLEVEFSHY